MAVTIKDIAKRSGKSITTVSRALADYDDVSPATREMILDESHWDEGGDGPAFPGGLHYADATINAFLDHGTVERTVDSDFAGDHQVLDDLAAVGLSIDQITAQLEDEGIATFITSYDGLLADVEAKRAALAGATAE